MSGNVKGLSGRLVPKSVNIKLGLDSRLVSREVLNQAVPYAIGNLDVNIPTGLLGQPGDGVTLGVGTLFQDLESLRTDVIDSFTSVQLRFRPEIFDPIRTLIKSAEELAPAALTALALVGGGAHKYIAAGYSIGETVKRGLERFTTPKVKTQSGNHGGTVTGAGVKREGKVSLTPTAPIDGAKFLGLKPWERSVYLDLLNAGKRTEAIAYLEERTVAVNSEVQDSIAEAKQLAEKWERSNKEERDLAEVANDETAKLVTSWYRGIPSSLKRVPNPENIIFRYYTDQAGLAAILQSSELVTDSTPLIVTPDNGKAGVKLVYEDVHGIFLTQSDSPGLRTTDESEYVDLRLRPGIPVFKVEVPGIHPTYVIPGRYDKDGKTGTKIRVSIRGSSKLGRRISESLSDAKRFIAWKGATSQQMLWALGTHGAPERDGYEATDDYYKPLRMRSGAPPLIEAKPVEFDEQEDGLLKFTWPGAEGQSIRLSVPLGQNGNNGNSNLYSDLTVRVENGKHVIKVNDLEIKGRKVRPSVSFLTVSFQDGISEVKPGEVVRPVAGDKVRIRFQDDEIDLNEAYYLRVPFTLQGNTDPSKIPDVFEQIGDAVISVPTDKGYDKYVRIVQTAEFLKKLVRFRMAFAVYRVRDSERPILAIANWANRERTSAHNLIRGGLSILNGEFNPDPRHWNNPKNLKWLDSGYLRPAPAEQREAGNYDFVIYELPGTQMYEGSNGTVLSNSAKRVKAALNELFPNLKIAFINDPEPDRFSRW